MSSSPPYPLSRASTLALRHLKRIRPNDGWSIEQRSSSRRVRLLRRSIPVSGDVFFMDIHYDSVSEKVVGIMTMQRNGPHQAQVLVDEHGRPHRSKTPVILQVTTYNPKSTHDDDSSSSLDSLSKEQNEKLIQYAAYAVGMAIAMKIILSAVFSLYILLLPIVYLYAVQSCPSQESFEPKRELKRILRGHHLPEDHPDKPKGWWNETVARVTASVSTELATGFGYEVSMQVRIE
eukprot:CAMPEP_0116838014 /NCGR_PEP_ID=MMETSP0418-20121206/8976_1 /TAXON_ID=1158023 /ORGANISM="Astrosyne radiata, Strain 13vi08-1A" /LENGTH=233 /DNA_ID=CAMNT_0004467967 /DNA_START=137 /DNA_END=838 /DNA_ORIENTATION=+